MANATMFTYLMHGTKQSVGSTYTYAKLVDITSYPDLGGTPNNLDGTTLSDDTQVNVPGIKKLDALEFGFNYDRENQDSYAALVALEGKTERYAVWKGKNASGEPDGSGGKWEFDAVLNVRVNGGSVDEVETGTITLSNKTKPEYSKGSAT